MNSVDDDMAFVVGAKGELDTSLRRDGRGDLDVFGEVWSTWVA